MKTTKLKKLHPCSDALQWVSEQKNPQQAWDDCERGDWMLWLLGKLSGDSKSKSRKKLVLAACECARLSLHLVPDDEDRPRIAIETAEKWVRGEASIDRVMSAAYAADVATYAAADVAAYAAYADSDAYAAADVATYAAYAAYAAVYAADATRKSTLKQCADIVRKHYPKVPKL